jgi:hypothetical protein
MKDRNGAGSGILAFILKDRMFFAMPTKEKALAVNPSFLLAMDSRFMNEPIQDMKLFFVLHVRAMGAPWT